ncbi:hypothetical protein NP493_452g04000 [Ridgeia piscesae]|uniref:C2H2-type domain-containing protein n=1 Tax=Ridgeia piscesae TaxID=27915 RepID=A0AAD9NUU1_RIDPI|nr:hypothetical protein NP493_452g04000 [Ridgeia piscesae]
MAHDESTTSTTSATSTDDGAAQGFICPMCKLTLPSGELLTAHFAREHDTKNEPDPNPPQQGSGFLCPNCKMSLPSPQELQTHFEHAHGQISTNSGQMDGGASRQRQTSGQRKDGLQQPHLVGNMSPHQMPQQQVQDELDMFRQQLRASEDSRTLLSSEVVLMRKQLNEALDLITSQRDEKRSLEGKAAKLAGDVVAAKARADESDGQRVALEDHLQTLKLQMSEKTRYIQSIESQLAQRFVGSPLGK